MNEKKKNNFRSAYLITKPLQYVNATNIPDERPKDCLIIKSFAGAETFVRNVSAYSIHWDKVFSFESRSEAFEFIVLNKNKYNRIFLDSDIGLFYHLSQFSGIDIFTYEEGIGSYRKIRDTTKLIEKLKAVIWSILGFNNWIGGNKFTKGIYLYNPAVFRQLIPNEKKPVYKLNNSFHSSALHLKELSYLHENIDFGRYKNENLLVYLSSWEISESILSKLESFPTHIKILKPHPNTLTKTRLTSHFDEVITSAIPVEIFLIKVSKYCNQLVIVHENSSALLYLNDVQYLEVNISTLKFKEEYRKIRELILNDTVVLPRKLVV
ncbi:MAG: hypothetical protein AAGU19_17300 [Prolixibacteraceae bacterium]